MSPVYFTSTKRGGRVLHFNGEQYYQNKTNKDRSILWNCKFYNKTQCPSFLITHHDVLAKDHGAEHYHGSDGNHGGESASITSEEESTSCDAASDASREDSMDSQTQENEESGSATEEEDEEEEKEKEEEDKAQCKEIIDGEAQRDKVEDVEFLLKSAVRITTQIQKDEFTPGDKYRSSRIR